MTWRDWLVMPIVVLHYAAVFGAIAALAAFDFIGFVGFVLG